MASGQSTVAKAQFHVPIEIAIEILSRLPVKSLLRFKSVCKTWYALIESTNFISKHLLNHSTLNSILITNYFESRFRGTTGMYLQYNNDVSDGRINFDFPFLHEVGGFSIVAICDGLVCLDLSKSGPWILCNPATRQFRKIPHYKWWDNYDTAIEWVTFGFGFHPSAGDYVLIRIMYHYHYNWGGSLIELSSGERFLRTDMYMMGTDTWRELDVTMPSEFFACGRCESYASAFLNGVLYWKMYNLRSNRWIIVSLDLDDEMFRITRLPECCNQISWQLETLKDKLALIIYPLRCKWFDVWVLNEDQISWTKQFRVGPFSRTADPAGFSGNGAIRLLGCAKNGELVIQEEVEEEFGGVKLFSYDPKDEELKNLPFDQFLYPSEVHMYVETLLAVKKTTES